MSRYRCGVCGYSGEGSCLCFQGPKDGFVESIIRWCEYKLLNAKYSMDAFFMLIAMAIILVPLFVLYFVMYFVLYPVWRPVCWLYSKGSK